MGFMHVSERRWFGVAMVALWSLAGYAAPGDFTLEGVPATVAPEASFTADLKLDVGTQPLGAFDLNVLFSPGVLEMTAAEKGDAPNLSNFGLDSRTPLPAGDNGRVRISAIVDAQTGPSGVLSLAKLTFKVKSGTEGQEATIGIDPEQVLNTEVTAIATNPFTPASIQVEGGATLSVSPESRNVPAAGGGAEFTVTTTGVWSAASDQPWAQVPGGSSTGTTLTVTVNPHTGTEQRAAVITVSGTDTTPASVQVTVIQEGVPVPDEDGDGVPDDQDQCPDTPAGLPVNEVGCPDTDGDGVFDDQDQCPNTPAGQPVDSTGCIPGDEDQDGVPNEFDLCPVTAPGAIVDENGCPLPGTFADLNGDGFVDAIDVQLVVNAALEIIKAAE